VTVGDIKDLVFNRKGQIGTVVIGVVICNPRGRQDY
jgi:ABC-type cobalt transport system substrate-binding protein